ncbi:MAG TPA: hypothetical protein VL493_02450 [Candidatus Saccharimonadales bacterium]|jgi:hypothetical protein|nr:hypothetical protein [Candidatus Saccharimonadales bacterium]
MRRDPRQVDERQPLPLRATSIVLGLWVGGLVVLAFVIVPALFATCGPNPGIQ